MLVLTRRVGEKLVIGNEVFIEVLSVSGDGIRLGITAPRETTVHRFEVFDEILKANRAASASVAETSSTSLEDFAAKMRNQKTDSQLGK